MVMPPSINTDQISRPERLTSSKRPSLHKKHTVFSIIQNVGWAAAHTLSCFLLQITELFAPFLLIIGLAWSAIPHVIGIANSSFSTATSDQQTKDLVEHVTHSIPMQLELSGHVLTPHGLIVDGIMLMLIAAISSTCATWLGRRL